MLYWIYPETVKLVCRKETKKTDWFGISFIFAIQKNIFLTLNKFQMKKLFAITLGFICLLAMTSVAHTRQPQSKENSVVACKSCHTIIPDYAYVIGDGDATEAVSYAYQPALTG